MNPHETLNTPSVPWCTGPSRGYTIRIGNLYIPASSSYIPYIHISIAQMPQGWLGLVPRAPLGR